MAGLEKVRFLVVDDNAHMQNIVKTILRGFGAEQVFEARDVPEAFRRLRQEPVDIVILDYQLETLDGVDFAKLVRTSPESPAPFVPIIMLTAHSERSRVWAARDAGVHEFCAKPVTATEMYRKVVSVIDHPRPFVRTDTYFGPDRRRRNDPRYDGPERRAKNV